jgi:hypothetical protein
MDLPRIGSIEAAIGTVLLVLDPWDAPLCLTRVWCLYELVQTINFPGTAVYLSMPTEERTAFLRRLRSRDTRAMVEQALEMFDARHAQASVEEDRAMIFGLILESGGFDQFNRHVRESMRHGLAASSWLL